MCEAQREKPDREGYMPHAVCMGAVRTGKLTHRMATELHWAVTWPRGRANGQGRGTGKRNSLHTDCSCGYIKYMFATATQSTNLTIFSCITKAGSNI